MRIIPTINCPDFNCVEERIKKASEFADLSAEAKAEAGWVQIDVTDGNFSSYKTWNNPGELRESKIVNSELKKINLEVHLMVEDPEFAIDSWIDTGAKRVIVHLEALHAKDIKENKQHGETEQSILKKLKNKNIEYGIAINPYTPPRDLFPHLRDCKFVQILAVPPGASNQNFDSRILDKIKLLKANYPDVKIEVDGGINLATGKLCKEAGADILVSGSYIWDGNNPRNAFEKLSRI